MTFLGTRTFVRGLRVAELLFEFRIRLLRSPAGDIAALWLAQADTRLVELLLQFGLGADLSFSAASAGDLGRCCSIG